MVVQELSETNAQPISLNKSTSENLPALFLGHTEVSLCVCIFAVFVFFYGCFFWRTIVCCMFEADLHSLRVWTRARLCSRYVFFCGFLVFLSSLTFFSLFFFCLIRNLCFVVFQMLWFQAISSNHKCKKERFILFEAKLTHTHTKPSYVFSKCALKLAEEKRRSITSIRAHLVPHLVKLQFSTADSTAEHIAAMNAQVRFTSTFFFLLSFLLCVFSLFLCVVMLCLCSAINFAGFFCYVFLKGCCAINE